MNIFIYIYVNVKDLKEIGLIFFRIFLFNSFIWFVYKIVIFGRIVIDYDKSN